MHIVHYDPANGRIFARASGFWEVQDARIFREDVRAACEAAEMAGQRISFLSDLMGYPPQAAEVRRINLETVAILAAAPIDRHALVVPSALTRAQVRRLMAAVEGRFFVDIAAALTWLGWGEFPREPSPAFNAVSGD